ncbi:MAG: tetratricopeptide repeat protein [Acidobacteriota bacterium]
MPLRLSVTRLVFFAILLLLIFSCTAHAQGAKQRQLMQEAFVARQHGDNTLAVQKYQELIRLYPSMVAAHANLGSVLASLGRFDEAIAQFLVALKEDPGNPKLRFGLARVYFKKGDFAKATSHLTSLHKDDPNDVRVATLLGDCYVHLRRYAQAVSLLTPIEKAHPDNLDLEWALGMALVGAGRSREGLVRVEKVAHQGNRPGAYLLAAEVYLKLTYYNRARTNAEEAIRLDPHLPGVYTVSGIIDTFFGNQKAAVAAFEKALQVNPNDAQAHLQLGVVFYTERKLGAARKQLDRALALQPDSSFALYELARVERAQGHLHAAVKDLEKVVREEPQWLPPHIELAALYYLLKRPADGGRETKIVNQLMAEEQQRGLKAHTVSPRLPSP